MTRQHTTGLALRHVLQEAAPLVGEADQPTGGQRLPGGTDPGTLGYRREQHQPVDALGRSSGDQPARHRAPGMGEQGHAVYAAPRRDEFERRLELPRRLAGAIQRRSIRQSCRHRRIAARATEAEEIEPPYGITGSNKRIAPGSSVEAIGDRQSGGESRAVDVKDGPPPRPPFPIERRQAAEEERAAGIGKRQIEMLLAGIELRLARRLSIRHGVP